MTAAVPVVRLAVVCAALWLAAKLWAVAVGPPRGPGRREALWWLWPGLERRRFLFGTAAPPPGSEWIRGGAFAGLGAGLFLLGGRLTGGGEPLTGGLCAAVGFVLALHFGAFHLLALALRTRGIDAVPLMDRPLSAATLAEFWGRRWNTAFARLTRDALFAPLARRFGPGLALWAGFAISGTVHEAALTLPVYDRPGALYGGPFVYFLLQAAGATLERRLRKRGRLRGFRESYLRRGVARSAPAPAVIRGVPAGRGGAGGGSRVLPPQRHGGLTPRRPPEAARHELGDDMNPAMNLETCVRLAGVCQLGILTASALVPFRLDWRAELACLSALHRQMYWTYGAYTAGTILAFGLLAAALPGELAAGTPLARGVCGYLALFWGARLCLLGVFDVREHLVAWWLTAGYWALNLVFAGLFLVYGAAATL